jgi:hypothetical protein
MRRIGERHLEHPFYGARRVAKQLKRERFEVPYLCQIQAGCGSIVPG